jgi:hypothetical protein
MLAELQGQHMRKVSGCTATRFLRLMRWLHTLRQRLPFGSQTLLL